DQVLGTFSRKDTLYAEGYSVIGRAGFESELGQAVMRLPEITPPQREAAPVEPAPRFVPPPLVAHIVEGSFFVKGKVIHQVVGGEAIHATFGGKTLRTDGTTTGKRLGALLEIRDLARRVLKSQNDGWTEAHRNAARRDLNWAYERFVRSY